MITVEIAAWIGAKAHPWFIGNQIPPSGGVQAAAFEPRSHSLKSF